MKFSLEKLKLRRLVPFFWDKNVCPKFKQKKQNQNKFNEDKMFQLASWSSDLICSDL